MRRLLAILSLIALCGCQAIDVAALRAPGPDPLLVKASDALEVGDGVAASRHLREFAARHPESKTAEPLCGEVLFKLARYGESKDAFEKAIARLDGDADVAIRVHCHGRLVELAAIDADDAAEHLNRGIGIYLLSTERSPDPDEEIDPESILCKAILELNAAHLDAPNDARPCWYLHLAFRRLGKDQPARRWLHECERLAPLSVLTPGERHGLDLRLAETSLR
jgi:tetratricopeptide (TPR) repeat protein